MVRGSNSREGEVDRPDERAPGSNPSPPLGPSGRGDLDGLFDEFAELPVAGAWFSEKKLRWRRGPPFTFPASLDEVLTDVLERLRRAETTVVAGPFPLWGGELLLAADAGALPASVAMRELLCLLGSKGVERAQLEHDHSQALAELHALNEISVAGNSGLELEQVLQQAIETLGGIVDAESGGCLLYDEATDQLILQKPAFGVYDEDLIGRYCVAASGGSNAAIVFRTGQPYVSNEADKDPRLVQTFIRLYKTRSTLSVPLAVGNQRVGVFHVINKRKGPFTARDLRLVELIAPHLAVLIRNSQLYEELRRKHESLLRSRNISEKLTQKVLSGASLADILRSLAELLGTPCLLLAGTGMVEERGKPPHRDSIPWDAFEDEARRALLDGKHKPLSICSGQLPVADRDVPYISAPIMTGRELRAHLVVAFWDRMPGLLDEQAIEQAATVMAVELLVQQREWDIERRLKGDLVEDLLTDRRLTPEEASRRAAYAGLDLGRPMRVAAITWEARDSASLTRRPPPKARTWMWHLLSRRWPSLMMGQIGRATVLVIPIDENNPNVADTIVADLDRELVAEYPGFECRSGIGRAGQGIRELRDSFQDSMDCLEVLHAIGGVRGTLHYEDLGVAGLLIRHARSDDIARLLRDTLSDLLQDTAYHRELLDTLWCFYNSGGDRRAAADRLSVHPNTVTYRLHKVSEITGLDIARPNDLTRLNIACLLYRLGRDFVTRPLDRTRASDQGEFGNPLHTR